MTDTNGCEWCGEDETDCSCAICDECDRPEDDCTCEHKAKCDECGRLVTECDADPDLGVVDGWNWSSDSHTTRTDYCPRWLKNRAEDDAADRGADLAWDRDHPVDW